MKTDAATARSWVEFMKDLKAVKLKAAKINFWMSHYYIDMAERQVEWEVLNHLKIKAKERKNVHSSSKSRM